MNNESNKYQLKNDKDCCGCSACMNICPYNAIEMNVNDKGFQVPIVDAEKCKKCGLCEKVCSFYEKTHEQKEFEKVHSFQKKIGRKKVQSGGAFSSIAEIVLKMNGVVYGVTYVSDKCEATYLRVVNNNSLYKICGSKYIQAKTNDVIKRIVDDLKNKKSVLVSGTPCFIDGLNSFLKLKSISTEKLFTCDLICHGVPSEQIYKDYCAFLFDKFGGISNFNFRNKRISGWHGHVETFCTQDKKFLKSTNFVNIFYSHLCLRESCYNCHYSNRCRVSDITIGDFWGIEEMDCCIDDNRGTSVLICNTEKGKLLLSFLYKKGRVREFILDYFQPNLRKSTNKPEKYNDFWNAYFTEGFLFSTKKYCGFEEDGYKQIGKYSEWIGYYRRYFAYIYRKIKKVLFFKRNKNE